MFRIFTIWISFFWISLIPAQSIGDNFKLAYPDLVHQGKSFEISLITSNEFENADQLDLYIIPQRGIKLDEVITKLANNRMGFINKYFTPTFYMVFIKKGKS